MNCVFTLLLEHPFNGFLKESILFLIEKYSRTLEVGTKMQYTLHKRTLNCCIIHNFRSLFNVSCWSGKKRKTKHNISAAYHPALFVKDDCGYGFNGVLKSGWQPAIICTKLCPKCALNVSESFAYHYIENVRHGRREP